MKKLFLIFFLPCFINAKAQRITKRYLEKRSWSTSNIDSAFYRNDTVELNEVNKNISGTNFLRMQFRKRNRLQTSEYLGFPQSEGMEFWKLRKNILSIREIDGVAISFRVSRKETIAKVEGGKKNETERLILVRWKGD
jgi:hypothetical protein